MLVFKQLFTFFKALSKFWHQSSQEQLQWQHLPWLLGHYNRKFIILFVVLLGKEPRQVQPLSPQAAAFAVLISAERLDIYGYIGKTTFCKVFEIR
jgi:hypothetical protein